MSDEERGIVARACFAAAGVSPDEEEIREFAASVPWLQGLVDRYRSLAEEEAEPAVAVRYRTDRNRAV